METSQMIKKVNATYDKIVDDITTERGTYNTGILATYILLLFKLAFGSVEKEIGLAGARRSFKNAVDYMIDTVIDGGYDKKNDKIKI